MKNSKVSIFSLLVLAWMAEMLDWPIVLRVCVIVNALFVLYQCISTLLIYFRTRKENNHE